MSRILEAQIYKNRKVLVMKHDEMVFSVRGLCDVLFKLGLSDSRFETEDISPAISRMTKWGLDKVLRV